MATANTAKKKGTAADPKWGRNAGGQFYRLSFIEPDKEGLDGVGGIFVAWHAGVKPRWIAVDRSRDLAASIIALADDEEIRQYQVHGGVYATWALIRDAHQDSCPPVPARGDEADHRTRPSAGRYRQAGAGHPARGLMLFRIGDQSAAASAAIGSCLPDHRQPPRGRH